MKNNDNVNAAFYILFKVIMTESKHISVLKSLFTFLIIYLKNKHACK